MVIANFGNPIFINRKLFFLISMINQNFQHPTFYRSSLNDIHVGFLRKLSTHSSCIMIGFDAPVISQLNVIAHYSQVSESGNIKLSSYPFGNRNGNSFKLNSIQSVTIFNQTTPNSSTLFTSKSQSVFQVYFGPT
jgi:hypothetical protein